MTKNEEKLLKRMADAAFDTVGEHVRSIDSLSKRISELEKDKRSEVNKKWVYLHMSKIYGRIQGLKKNAESMKTNIQRKGINFAEHQMYNESEFKKIHDRISHAFDRLDNLTIDCADLGKDVKANKANFQAKGGILLRHREMTEEGLRDLNSRIERIERKLDESCHPFPESVSMDNKYRCPLCGATGYLSSDITNCECGAKLKLSHHGKIVCLYKSYEAEVYKI